MRMVAVSVRCSDRIGSASTFARAPTPRQRCVPSAACGCVPEMVDPENDHGQRATRLRIPPLPPPLSRIYATRALCASHSLTTVPYALFPMDRTRPFCCAARAHAARARRRYVYSTKIKALPAWLGNCTKLQRLCAPARSEPALRRMLTMAAATTRDHERRWARSEYRPAADGAVWSRAMLACVHHATRTHDSGAADRSGAGYVCADAGRLTCAGMRLRARSRRCRARGSGRSCKSCACRRLARIVRRTADGIHARARDPRRARCESK